MIGAALHHDGARSEDNQFVIEDEDQFALDQDAIVDRLGAMHQRMRRVGANSRSLLVTDLGEGRFHRGRTMPEEILAVGRDVDEANARAVSGWGKSKGSECRVIAVVDRRRRGRGRPDFMKHRARDGFETVNRGQGTLGGDVSRAIEPVPGHDPFDRRKFGMGRLRHGPVLFDDGTVIRTLGAGSEIVFSDLRYRPGELAVGSTST
jgi:hypothetical protein